MGAGQPIVGYVPGAFDMFHIGHLNILRNAAMRCDVLVAGVVIDHVVLEMKGARPVIPLEERLAIVSAIDVVDEAIIDESVDKRLAWRTYPFDVVFKGSDWFGTERGARLEKQMAEIDVRVEYLPYTRDTSSTLLREALGRLVNAPAR